MSMIKFFIYTLFTLVTGLLVTVFLAREPGYLLVSFAGSTFETSLFALFVVIMVFLILLRLLILVIDLINPMRMFYAGRKWSRSRAERQASVVPVTDRMRRDALYDELAARRVAKEKSVTSVAELRKIWKTRTKTFVPDEALIGVYVDVLVLYGGLDDALNILEDALQLASSDLLVRQYSFLGLRIDDAGAARQLEKAEVWLGARPKDAQLLLALGRISLRNHEWVKAREYFELSLRQRPSTEVFAEIARLLHSMKEPVRRAQFLAKETELVSRLLPDFPQP